ncbi:MAG: hypothetical protein GY805_06315, partial [Chloroflexi bacterium]|nr:hypothetical protein [Chloroflexota bacterium]
MGPSKKSSVSLGGPRGRKIEFAERVKVAKWSNEACIAGASQLKACVVLGIAPRTLQRWQEGGQVKADSRGTSNAHSKPHNKLSLLEQQRILEKDADARRKLARDLHDGPTQSIAAIAMRLNFIKLV